MEIARLAGSVHGVVVQITSEIGPLTLLTPNFVSAHPDRPPGKRRRWTEKFVVILNFRFCQCRTAVNAPVHRLRAFVQVTVADDFAQRADDVGFSFEVHGQVRVRPVAQHAQTDKVFALTVNLGRSVFAALGAELSGGEFLPGLPYSCSTFSSIGRP